MAIYIGKVEDLDLKSDNSEEDVELKQSDPLTVEILGLDPKVLFS